MEILGFRLLEEFFYKVLKQANAEHERYFSTEDLLNFQVLWDHLRRHRPLCIEWLRDANGNC